MNSFKIWYLAHFKGPNYARSFSNTPQNESVILRIGKLMRSSLHSKAELPQVVDPLLKILPIPIFWVWKLTETRLHISAKFSVLISHKRTRREISRNQPHSGKLSSLVGQKCWQTISFVLRSPPRSFLPVRLCNLHLNSLWYNSSIVVYQLIRTHITSFYFLGGGATKTYT